MSRKLPIGMQSFKDLREKNFLYVDKTAYIFRLVNTNKVYFLSRPRRFGKSLFLSTLAAYFLGQKELFKGLFLEQAEKELTMQENRSAWQEYPVLYLDFNTGNYGIPEDLTFNLNNHLCKWEKLYGVECSEQTPALRFAGIIERAYEKTGKQVVILNEVRYGFLENLLPAYSGLSFGETGVSVWRFVEDIRKGNVDGFMERMQAIIAGIPYDNFSEEKMNLREQNYQTAVYLIFALKFVQTEIHCYSSAAMDGGCSTQKRCFDKVETRSQNYTRTYSFDDATGRADCIVWTADAIYIFEFKLTGNGTADDAINQIKEKNYTMQYTVSGKKIILIGAGFDDKIKTIKDWKIELL